jgi:hypothetical protein
MCVRRRPPEPVPAGSMISPRTAGVLLLNACCSILRDDPDNPLALTVAGIAARLARTPAEPLPVAPWLRARFAPLLAAAAGLAGEADDLRVAADDELAELRLTTADERVSIADGQLRGGRRARP